MSMNFGPRRAVVINVLDKLNLEQAEKAFADKIESLTFLDQVYRGLCPILFNYVPGSGHPGGSISSGRIVLSLFFNTMEYNLNNPDEPSADLISYAAGHKALGLYAAWALRNEIARIGAPTLLPKSETQQLRLEDLLGFRRNPKAETPLFSKFNVKALDGHPTPATPFLKLATGASGVGVASSFGLAFAARDIYREDAPFVHVIEGEGGMTAGRVMESMASAGTTGVDNLIFHIDWNQASIDSNRVCRDGSAPGDYVQWDPAEIAYLHDFNVVMVPDGFDFNQILTAQHVATTIKNGQPTAIVYRTVKGWQYGIEGKASHGSGHKLCSPGFVKSIASLSQFEGGEVPTCPEDSRRCKGNDATTMEACYWEALEVVRHTLEQEKTPVNNLASYLVESRSRLEARARQPHASAANIAAIYDGKKVDQKNVPPSLALKSGTSITIRETLGNVLNHLNHLSHGAFLGAAADLMGSTSLSNMGKGFGEGFLDFRSNPDSRLLSIGGICEDGICGLMTGISGYGHHVGVGSSYGAFIVALGHIASRLHCIGSHSRLAISPNQPFNPFILIAGHAGLKTGEDGPTHADPQPLQLVQENFPKGAAITLTPWEPQEVWPLVVAALQKRPALLVPFVTRPSEPVLDRESLRLAPASDAAKGVYLLRSADSSKPRDGTLVLQESGVTYAFVQGALPKLDQAGYNLNVYYVASLELFDSLTQKEQQAILPEELATEAMGITGFTMATMYRWIRSDLGRNFSMHPFMHGHYLGSGQASAVIKEAGLDGDSQFNRICEYVKARRERSLR